MNWRKMGLVSVCIGLWGCGNSLLLDSATATGTLVYTVSENEILRDEVTSRDNWRLRFDHAWVHIVQPRGIQVEVATDGSGLVAAHAGHTHAELPQGRAHAVLAGGFVVDIATMETDQELGREVDAPTGNYNMLQFDLAPATSSSLGVRADLEQFSIVLQGRAVSGPTELKFSIRLDESLRFRGCGPTATGVVARGGVGEIAITLRLEQLFAGDGDTAALGFSAFAELAEHGTVSVTQAGLRQRWRAEVYDRLVATLQRVGYTGRAKCRVENGPE